MKDDPLVDIFADGNEKRINFLENMIDDKSLLEKKHKRRKSNKNKELLNPESNKDWYRFCRNFVYYTVFNYKIAKDYMSEYYVSLFRK